MTNKGELKKSISSAIKEGNFAIAFEQLLTLPHHEVASLLSKNNWLKEKPISNFFWGEFCLINFEAVFDSVAQETILNWYLGNPDSSNRKLNSMLSTKHPATFIKAIKRNRSFLNDDSLAELLDLPWGAEHSVDILAWGELQKVFNAYQTEITDSWLRIEDQCVEVLLSGIIHWIDVRFYKDNSPLNHEKLRWVYNFAVNYLFSKKEIVDPKTEEQFDENFLKTIHSSMVNGIDRFLTEVSDWIEFETTVLSSYCFDDNFQATLQDGLLYFDFKSNEKYDEWKKDSERYLVNSMRYFVDSAQRTEGLIETGKLVIPQGRLEGDKHINYNLQLKCCQSALFLRDLQLNNLWFNGRGVNCSKFLRGLLSYSVNRQWRYNEIMKQFIQAGSDWNHSLLYSMKSAQMDGVDNNPLPYIYESLESIVSLYKHAMPELNEDEIIDLLNHFSYTLKPGNEINPFHVGYSVSETPFIRMGQYLLTPTSLFASNEWFYSIAQRILNVYASKNHTKERNDSAGIMEVKLSEKFKKQGWKSKVISEQEASKIDGDIDIFVNDGNSQLLIQLKRTKFKLDLASDYKDSIETDLKASGQLNEAIRMLEANPLQGMEILNNHERWIVTTSFEGVLSRVDGCLKVNYFDLLWALRYKKFDSLDELKEYIEGDKPFKDCRHYLEL